MAIGTPDDMRRQVADMLRRNDQDGLVALLERNPELIRFVSGRDAQRYLVDRPEMQDYKAEIGAIKESMGEQRSAQEARNEDLMAQLGLDESLAIRFGRDAAAQTARRAADARRATAGRFEERRNTPTRNAPATRIFDAAERGYAKQGQTGANIAGGVGLTAGTVGAVLAAIAAAGPTLGASLATIPAFVAPLAAGLTAGGAAISGAGKIAQSGEASRRAMQLGGQRRAAAAQAARAPSYTAMFPQLQQQAVNQTLTLDPLDPQDDDSGYAWG